MRSRLNVPILLGQISFLFLLHSLFIIAQDNSISGLVLDEKDNEPLLGVNILIDELKTGQATNANGEFQFADIQPGTYSLKASYIGHKTVIQTVSVPQTEKLIIYLQEGTVNLQEIVVTGNPLTLDPKDFTQSTLSLSGLELQIRNSSTVAEILNFQPGISIRSNGTAASRPVIRGFSNNRVLILENGLRMGDLSNTSDDHGVSGDAGTSERIEVLRGPASLLYGSNAIGGVINIITEAIPNFVPHHFDGVLNLGTSTVNKEFNGGLDLHYGFDRLAFHGNYFNRDNSDYKDGLGNTVINSDQESNGYQLGMSFIPAFGIGGLSYSNFKNSYGIPAAIHSEEEGEEEDSHEGPIKIDMKKQELRFLLEGSNIKSFINSFSFKAGYQDYLHDEIIRTTGEAGTSFGLKSFSGDLSFKHSPLSKNIQGVFGLWSLIQNYTVSGEEAFTPNADYLSFAAYLLEQIKLDKLNIQFGGRYEYSRIKIPSSNISETFFHEDEKNFSTISGSLGLVYNFQDVFSVFTNFANAFRAPTIEELSSYAIHEATGSFDVGDRNLSIENNFGFDLGFRLRKEHHLVEVSGYYNLIKDYIFRQPTNLFYSPEDENLFNDSTGFPVFQYNQADAILYGAEFKAQYDFTNHLTTTVVFDYVKGYQKETEENLPQMPPVRFSIEQRYTTDYYWFGVQLKLVAQQDKVAENENPTKGYGLVDFNAGLKLITGEFIHMLNLRVDNLFDQPYKEHLSAIKDFAYMPGRNIKLNYKFLF